LGLAFGFALGIGLTPVIVTFRVTVGPCTPPLALVGVRVRTFVVVDADLRNASINVAGTVKRMSFDPGTRAPAPSEIEPIDALELLSQ
jgi:hypothetical protein